MPWPVDALERVAEYFISSMKLNQTEEEAQAEAKIEEEPSESSMERKSISIKSLHLSELEQDLVQVVMYFNQSVVEASEK